MSEAKVEPFVNFGEDKKGFWARCTNCFQQYRDWDARKAIALCPECRPGLDRQSAKG